MRSIYLAFLVVSSNGCVHPLPPPCSCESAPAARKSPDKRSTLEAMLTKGPVLIRIDSRAVGVVVPAKHASDPTLILRVGRDLYPPVADLVIDDRGVSGSLQFDGQPFHCMVPWPALYGMQLEVPEQEQVWRADVPKDLPAQ